ncbi:LLM class flavin-dependent oxidoreductase, partial [Nocardioides sp. AN3]
YASTRYDVAEEWTKAVKALWTGEPVTFEGEYFSLEDCKSLPTPIREPHPAIVCAGMSERGMDFTARHGERCFITGTDFESLKSTGRRAKEVAKGVGTTIKTDTVLVLIIEDTDEEANAVLTNFRDGVDVDAWSNIFRIYSKDVDGASSQTVLENARRDVFFGFLPVAGSASTVANILTDLVSGGDLDGLLLTFPDYLEGLRRFDQDVRPIMESRGVPFTTSTNNQSRKGRS